jgi:hypothetical protein
MKEVEFYETLFREKLIQTSILFQDFKLKPLDPTFKTKLLAIPAPPPAVSVETEVEKLFWQALAGLNIKWKYCLANTSSGANFLHNTRPDFTSFRTKHKVTQSTLLSPGRFAFVGHLKSSKSLVFRHSGIEVSTKFQVNSITRLIF